MPTSHDTLAMEPGPNQSTTTTTSLPVPTNAEHILVEPRVVPANFPAATKPPPGKTNADVDDPEEDDEDAPLLPRRVKFTGYRLLNILVIFTIGLAKFILSLKGQSIAPTVLEWAGGSVLTILLYWIGLYEAVEPPMWEWFFHVDWAPAIIFFSKCFLGGGSAYEMAGVASHTGLGTCQTILSQIRVTKLAGQGHPISYYPCIVLDQKLIFELSTKTNAKPR
ncbi:hypothetical protein BC827DRAFT_1157903 [Russula dissimulans]|nr:hypothetical protein BC827DRAFT_1157903 [Russula dissimulans]